MTLDLFSFKTNKLFETQQQLVFAWYSLVQFTLVLAVNLVVAFLACLVLAPLAGRLVLNRVGHAHRPAAPAAQAHERKESRHDESQVRQAIAPHGSSDQALWRRRVFVRRGQLLDFGFLCQGLAGNVQNDAKRDERGNGRTSNVAVHDLTKSVGYG